MFIKLFVSLLLLLNAVGFSIIVPRYDLNETDPLYWYLLARKSLQRRERLVPLPKRSVKNVVLFLGDGMGISTITASRILKGQLNGEQGEESMLEMDRFPHSALIKTYNVDQQIPDSAATATAFLAGVKNHFHTIGVSAKVQRNDPDCDSVQRNSVDSIFTWAIDSGKLTGVVTTARVTHATPAAAYAHSQNRKWESNVDPAIINGTADGAAKCKDIATQLIEDEPGRRINVILGGGRKSFLPKSVKDPRGIKGDHRGNFGDRTDGRNLIDEWLQQRRRQGLNESEYAYVNSTRGLRRVDHSRMKFLFGLFNYSHMEYDLLRDNSLDGEPSLSEMTETAIRVLTKHENGFVLLVEGGLIDQAHHAGYASLSLFETLEFDRAIRVASTMLPEEETLIVVTADHSQPLVINGYSHRGNPINGLSKRTDAFNWPYSTLMYASGPGYKTALQRSNTNNSELEQSLHDLKYQFHSAIFVKKSFHSGEDVALFSTGPMSHLFGGVLEQSYIAHAMGYASCIGPYRGEIHCRRFSLLASNQSIFILSMATAIIISITLIIFIFTRIFLEIKPNNL